MLSPFRRWVLLALILLVAQGCARAPTPVERLSGPMPSTGRDRVLLSLEPWLERNRLGGILSTLISSAAYALSVVTPKEAQRWRAESGFEEMELQLANGTRVGGIFFEYGDGTPDPKPLLMGSFGMFQDRWGTESRKFYDLYLEDPERRIPAHVLILDHPTAGAFFANNDRLSVGSYDDARMWMQVARFLRSELELSGIHLFGVSMSGQTVVHSVIEDKRLGSNLFDSAIAVSIAPDFRTEPGGQFAQLPTRGGVENPWKRALAENRGSSGLAGLERAAIWMLIKKLFLPSYRMARPDGDLQLERRDLAVFLWEACEARVGFLRERRPRTWNREFSLEGLGEFMTTTRIADVIDRVRTPLVLLSARDDPAVPRARFEEVLRAAGDNPWIAARETRRGGHFGFHVSYGADYLGDVLRLMISPEVLRSWTGQRSGKRQAMPAPMKKSGAARLSPTPAEKSIWISSLSR
jgi:pimeloyl-ACP methyl ester carboxylesterase